MKVDFDLDKQEFLVHPETEMEEELISHFYNKKLKAFVKTGMTASHIVGIKIKEE